MDHASLVYIASVRVTGHKTPEESSEIRIRLLEGSSTLYTRFTSLSVRVNRIRAKLVCLSIISKQAKVALEHCHASPYIHPLFKIATSWSNRFGVKDVVELRVSDMS